MSESARGPDFKNRVSPHLGSLLQISLGLTKNGRDATRLMREAIVEASRSWDESMPEESCDIRLYDILTRRYFNGFQPLSRSIASHGYDVVDDHLVLNSRPVPASTIESRRNSSMAAESNDQVNFVKAITGLPEMFRPAMILSYLEGFSNMEIAGLAGVKPHAIESLLDRGCGLLQTELYALLMGNPGFTAVNDREAKSA